jgi:iron complex transport system ATP-binding protein
MTNAINSVAISAHSMSVSLGNVPVLHDVSVAFAAGRWTSVVGPNGAGKSTLLKALAGLLPSGGSVCLLGLPLGDYPPRVRARQLAWLGQGEVAADELTVYGLAMLGRLPHQAWLGGPNARDHDAVEQALKATQAWEWRDRVVGQLSGGERQRVLLARALAVQAQVLLMDEPLANLDPPHQADWLSLVRKLVQQGKTVVSVLHEVSMALHADDLVLMDRGRVVHQGGCSDPVSHRALEAVFQQRISIHPLLGQWVALPRR